MAFNRLAAAAAAVALVGAAPPDAGMVASLRALADKDLRVATVAYRLQTAGLPLCAQRTALPGMIVQDASQYRADIRPAAAAALGLADLPAVTAVVPGGPAARAGVRAGDALVAIDGRAVATLLPPAGRRAADGDRFAAIVRHLSDAFAAGPVTLTLRRGGRAQPVRIAGTPACASLVQLDLAADRNAGADGRTVTVSQGLFDFVRDDDELALVVGHELAHNVLGHRTFLDSTGTATGLFAGFGGNGARIRDTEREADYWGLYLDAWAGYDVAAAVPFWQRMARAGWLKALFPDGTHPAYGERTRALAAEAEAIAARRAAGLPLDIGFARAGAPR